MREFIPKQIEELNLVLIGEYEKGVLTKGCGKRPAEKGWQKKIHRKDDLDLQEHLKKGFNYGVQPNNSVVEVDGKTYMLGIIDFDTKEFQDKVIDKFPETFTTTSGSSKNCNHLWFATDDNKAFKIKDEKLDTLADFIGSGNQIIAPNSIHGSGSIYSVVKDVPITFMPYAEIEAILKPHDTSPKKVKKPTKPYIPKDSNADFSQKMMNSLSMEDILSKLGVDTSKNPTNCFKHIDTNGGKCLSYNNEVAHCFDCNGAWNKFSVVREAKNLTDKDTFEWFANETGLIDELEQNRKEYNERKNPNKIIKSVVGVTEEKLLEGFLKEIEEKLENGNNDQFFKIEYNEKTGKETSRNVNIEFFAYYLTIKYKFKTIYGEKTERIKVYDNKIYSNGGRGLIKSVCEEILKSYARKSLIEEIFDKVKRKTRTTEEEFENTDLNLIPLNNGCYNLKTETLELHSPNNNFTFYSPINYNINSKCDHWFKFINEALYPEDIQLLKQWFGFNLFRQYFIKKALILLGKKNVGKTILLDSLIYFVGEKNKCGLSLQKISSGSDFSKFTLKGKLANIYDDLSSNDVNDTGAFKIATGGGYISAEEKFGECVQFKTYAKNSLAGNKAPPIKDNDDNAYFSRFLPIILDNIPNKIDPFLRDKIHTDEEMSGILNWALEGLQEILKKGRFDYNKTDEEIKKIMEMSGDILIQFGEEVLEQSNKKISKEDMYKFYCFWANANKKPILSKEQLGRRLNQKVTYLIAKKDAKIRFWGNVSLRIDWVEKMKSLEEKQNKGDQDTLDTISNFTRYYDHFNIVISKVKKSVYSDTDNQDTLDTFSDNIPNLNKDL